MIKNNKTAYTTSLLSRGLPFLGLLILPLDALAAASQKQSEVPDAAKPGVCS